MNKNIRFEQLSKKQIETFKIKRGQDNFLPMYHVTPPYGLLNDPNGLIQIGDTYYIHHQWYPGGPTHGIKYWRLLTTKDFVNYKDLGISNKPDSNWDYDGAFSGVCALVNNQYKYFYTGNKQEDGRIIQRQIMADMDNEGMVINKTYIIDNEKFLSHEFRDPAIFDDQGQVKMIVGACDNTAKLPLYEITKDFEFNFLGNLQTMYLKACDMIECPNVFSIDNHNYLMYSTQGFSNDDKFSLQNHFNVIVQEFDSIDGTKLVNEQKMFELDLGPDFYAPQVFRDNNNRVIMYGWLGDGKSKYNDLNYGYMNCLTIPRQLKVNNGQLCQYPVAELKQLRIESVLIKQKSYILKNTRFELKINEVESLNIRLGNKSSYLELDFSDVITFDRSKCDLDITSLHSDIRYIKRTKKIDDITIFVDNSTIEVFVNHNQNTITSRFFINDLDMIMFNQELDATLHYLDPIKVEEVYEN